MFRKLSLLIKNLPQNGRINFNPFKRNIMDISYYEPPYLEASKPKLPFYEALTVQVQGYDYPVLESFQKFSHNVAHFMDINIEMCWAHPAQSYNVQKFKSKSNVTESTYKLITFERNMKLINVDVCILPVFIETIQAALPEGTTLKIFLFEEEHEKDRYVPDHELNAKLKELDEMGGPPPPAK